MYEVYWGCLIGGMAFGLLSLLIGDGVADALDGLLDGVGFDGLDFLHPMTILSAVVVFGGAGIMLSDYSGLSQLATALVSGGVGITFAILAFFVYVRPMKNTESSLGYSVTELVGRTGEVSIPIPEGGHGEVVIRIGSQAIYQIARSYNDEEIPVDASVVVVEVAEGVVSVISSNL